MGLIDDIIDGYRSSLGDRLFTIHTTEGKYVAFTKDSFARYGIETSSLVGGCWQEYSPCAQVDTEMTAVAAAAATEPDDQSTAYIGRVVRFWPDKVFEMQSVATPIRSKSGVKLILRGSIDQAELSRAQAASLRRDHHAALQTAESVSAMLDGLLFLDKTDLGDDLTQSIARARKEVDAIRNRYIRQLI